MTASTPLTECRICQSQNLKEVLDLGVQAITGVFPKTREEVVPSGPLRLLLCNTCGLVQLGDDYNLDDIYTDSYGYRSSLNKGMVNHLRRKATKLMRRRPIQDGEMVVDIGSNDGTLLSFFPGCRAVGIDPLGEKFRAQYEQLGLELIAAFFGSPSWFSARLEQQAAIITSVAMFYDLPNPTGFVAGIKNVLAPDGIWHLEMSYLPTMLAQGSIDTVCHEHLEYYSLFVLRNLFQEFELEIVDVELNSVNGGSIALTVMHEGTNPNPALVSWMLEQEENAADDFHDFRDRARDMKYDLRSLLSILCMTGAKIGCLGASTKGNVLLQYCEFTNDDIDFVMDVNPEKHGRFTPGTLIPIVSEEEGRKRKPDYMLVPIWHFREGVIEREREYLANGGKLIFPLPRIEVVG